MAEVLRAFGAEDNKLCMPHRELLAEEQRIVEEAVAEELDFTLKIGGRIRGGTLVVGLEEDHLVYYAFGLLDSLIDAETV